MVKKEEYINCLYHLFNLPLEIVERIIYFLFTYQFNTPLELRQALENYPDSVKRYGECSRWDVTQITDMSLLFAKLKFQGNISVWDTSQVINMQGMFFRSDFQGDISKWDVGKVSNFNNMFADSNFTGNLSNWNLNSALDKRFMCYNCEMPDKIILPKTTFPKDGSDRNLNIFEEEFIFKRPNDTPIIEPNLQKIIFIEPTLIKVIPSRRAFHHIYLYRLEDYNFNRDLQSQKVLKEALDIGYLP